MYRKDVLEQAGVTMPDTSDLGAGRRHRPASQQPDMAGICLRGKPGWGDLGASLTTVLNTFGGTWWYATRRHDRQGPGQHAGFKKALNSTSHLVKDAGEKDAAERRASTSA